MKIHVDFDRCQSNGLCAQEAPEVFSLDEQRYLQLATDETTPENLAHVEQAIRACPMAAISLD